MAGRNERSLDDVMMAVKSAVVQNVRMQHRAAEAAVANRIEAIVMAINLGATWDEVGAAMGMSRQAAHRRFSNGVRAHTSRRRH